MSTSITSIDPWILLSYYQAQMPVQSSSAAPAQGATQTAASPNSATANDNPPWNTPPPADPTDADAQAMQITDFLDTSNVPLSATTADTETEQDNQKLFSLYTALNNLSTLASLSQQTTATQGQLDGYNQRFQTGLQQVESYLQSTSFNNFTLQTSTPSSSVTGTVTMPTSLSTAYTGATVVGDANVGNPLAEVSSSDSFTIAIAKDGVTTNVPIDLSQVQGPLTLDNIVGYINQQLQSDGFSSRFSRTVTEGSIDDPTDASYGIAINASPFESVSLSSSQATPSLYVAGSDGSPTSVTMTTVTTDATTSATSAASTTGSDQQGRLVKLSGLTGTPQTAFSADVAPTSGNTVVGATAVDANGDIYVVGNATGNFGTQINQGAQDAYLSKYDSAGNLEWTRLLGSADTASGYALATTPQGGVVIAGSTTADLSDTAIADGNNDSFVAKYDADGNQVWRQQIQTLADNRANAVSVDSSGNIYIGGQVAGEIGAGQTDSGGNDAYLAKLNSAGAVVAEQQFGTSDSDKVAATATTAGGDLVVASVQNGDAIVSKYVGGNISAGPAWQIDLGALQSGGIGGLTVSGDSIYVSGTTTNGNLTAGGQAAIANPSTGTDNAFVAQLTDAGPSATANSVSYVAAPGGDTTGGQVTVGSDGTIYLTGTTTGTFAGATRNVQGTDNAFVAALNSGGGMSWAQQFGGADDQSSGRGIAVDTQGSSVLDALGLPRGTLDTNNQTVDLTQATTLRAGDSFSIDIAGTVPRTLSISIDQGETLSSLADKISGALAFDGNATVSYTGSGEALQIQVDPEITATLNAGPQDSDALARLGIATGTISNDASGNQSGAALSSTDLILQSVLGNISLPGATSSGNTTAPPVFGLGLPSSLDISSTTDAAFAQSQLQAAMTAIENAYQTTNTPAGLTGNATQSATGGAAMTGNLSAQYANYSDALSLLTSSGSSSNASTLSLLA